MYYNNRSYFINNKSLSIEGRISTNENTLEKVGYLKIDIHDLISQTPVENVLVRVSSLSTEGLYNEIGKGHYFAANRTDSNGSVPIVTLPVIKSENEMYVLSVNVNGYHSAYILNIPIYPNIITSYKILITRVASESEPAFKYILQPLMQVQQY